MTQTVPASLRTRDGRQAPAELTVRQYRATTRWLRAGTVVVVTSAIGAATIIIPAVHFASVWAIPLLGLWIASWVYQIRGTIDGVVGRCPACDHELSAVGLGAFTKEALWLHCAACSVPVELLPGPS